jgi:uncharacterized membrane protein YdbT with pleckstrin-like domain
VQATTERRDLFAGRSPAHPNDDGARYDRIRQPAEASQGHSAISGNLLFLLLAVFARLQAWIAKVTTEIAVTNRRVMIKRGLIRRSTIEMNLGQVETVGVEQSIAGRLLDFATVIVRGTGAGIEPIGKIAAPLRMREGVGVMRLQGQ